MGNASFVPARSYLVSPNDSTDLPRPTDGFICDVAGTITFTGSAGGNDTWTVAAGVLYPMAVRRILLTGTTATGIHGLCRG